jgi:YaiO family outer membrane protein
LSHPIDRKTTGRIEAGSSPSYHYLPKFQVLAGASHVVASGWVGHLDYRHTDYRPNAVDQISAGTDKYFASFRAGYTFSWSAIPGEEGVIGNRLVFEHYLDPEAQNRIAIALAAGQELENTQGQVVKTRVHSVWLYGRQPVNPRVSIVWQMAFGAHSSYVQREAGLAFRTSF